MGNVQKFLELIHEEAVVLSGELDPSIYPHEYALIFRWESIIDRDPPVLVALPLVLAQSGCLLLDLGQVFLQRRQVLSSFLGLVGGAGDGVEGRRLQPLCWRFVERLSVPSKAERVALAGQSRRGVGSLAGTTRSGQRFAARVARL
ncbi:hypothetical protein [Pseudomonas phage vB_Pae_BR299a]|nr:hypothetical protein [Pseudomonas phage vB_Pae_CF28b]QBI77931.1 hypothetical protein [Pseudomonas phage vB_Pae_CF165a]QBI78428.1 hypothetical protein [Pseudomonas phage vB_Pae_BR200a]QBI78566.1 hypothetical protein [Pseudomonas phage vB_Pae_BR213a]QBI78673.1 hypothetical protein [Pseudomonas phage vB_Pae_BR299a]